MSGHLFMLFLETGENVKGTLVVKDLKVELLGKTTNQILQFLLLYLMYFQVKRPSPNASRI